MSDIFLQLRIPESDKGYPIKEYIRLVKILDAFGVDWDLLEIAINHTVKSKKAVRIATDNTNRINSDNDEKLLIANLSR